MQVATLAETIKDYGRDIRLNISSVLTEEGAPGLTLKQIWGIALASAYYTKSSQLIDALLADAQSILTELPEIESAKAAATVMAMNNIYYRFNHLAEDKSFSKMPARLRMNVIGKPGVPKLDFELMCLAVSALSGCGMCINAHIAEVQKAGAALEAVHSTSRIASVVNAMAQAISIG